jgi:hypothetical protein
VPEPVEFECARSVRGERQYFVGRGFRLIWGQIWVSLEEEVKVLDWKRHMCRVRYQDI